MYKRIVFHPSLGHYIYDGFRVLRLEFLIKQNYPELVEELRQSSEWIDDQANTNPYYACPVNVRIKKPYI